MSLFGARQVGICLLGCLTLGIAPEAAERLTTVTTSSSAIAWTTLYVDDDAPGDPGPNDPTVSDPLEDGSAAHPFDTIQEALATGGNELDIVVAAGSYVEGPLNLPPACRITGAGSGATRIQAAANGLLGNGAPQSESTVRGLSLIGGAVGFGFGNSVAMEDVAFSGVALDIARMQQVSMKSVSMTGGAFSATGGLSPMTLYGESLSLSGTAISLTATDYVYPDAFHVDLRHLDAPGSEITISSYTAGRLVVNIEDSTVGAITSPWNNASLDVYAERLHFTGEGVYFDTGEGGHTLQMRDSVFDHGGVTTNARGDSDAPNGITVELSGDTFRQGGVVLKKGYILPDQEVIPAWRIDSCMFLGDGIDAEVPIRPRICYWWGCSYADTRLSVTNSVFVGTYIGIQVTYDYFTPDADPTAIQDPISASIVNNTFVGTSRGIRFTTNEHRLGQNPITNLIQNNIVIGAVRGIEINGTDDQQFTIAGNDVYGSLEADYPGSFGDQTGLNGNISAAPILTDPATGDYSLQAGSPCVDAGQTGPAVPATDFARTPRPLDGDGDGTALPDIGAFEFNPVDADGDGYPRDVDCNDADPLIHPAAVDLPGNTIDEDCDGMLVCDPAAAWRSTSQFVGCVAENCNTLVLTGLVDPLVCNDLVSLARSSGTSGRKPRMDRTESIGEP